MSTLVFDIETIGDNFDGYDSLTKEVLLHGIDRETLSQEEYELRSAEVKEKLGLSALTGQIVAISVLQHETNKGAVYYQAPGQPAVETEEDGILYRPMGEKEILEKFWHCAARCDEFVTFNGRGFDVPFIMTRSAVHGIRPCKNLLSNRYLSLQRECRHVDLMDQLTYYGAIWKGVKLHLCCNAFGIPTPKSEGVDGGQVQKMFSQGRFMDIARYNMADVYATCELYRKWNDFLRI